MVALNELFSTDECCAILALLNGANKYQQSLMGSRRGKGKKNAAKSADYFNDLAEDMIRDLASKACWDSEKCHYADIWMKNELVKMFKPVDGWVVGALRQPWNRPRWEAIQLEEELGCKKNLCARGVIRL